MIKRSKRAKRTASGRSAEAIAELNGRPASLATAPPDPDSDSAWMADGNCRLHPPATFFPSDGVGVDKARKICRDCPVMGRCLEYALDDPDSKKLLRYAAQNWKRPTGSGIVGAKIGSIADALKALDPPGFPGFDLSSLVLSDPPLRPGIWQNATEAMVWWLENLPIIAQEISNLRGLATWPTRAGSTSV